MIIYANIKCHQDAHNLIDLRGWQELHKALIRLLQLAELSSFLDEGLGDWGTGDGGMQLRL